MCGIAGILGRRPVDPATLAAMTSQLAHRGPDGSGIWTDDAAGIGLGHRRLSIVDLSEAGHQPMISPCGRYVISFNGEIYNHRALRARLDACVAQSWRGHSDTETLLACISTWGLPTTLDRIVGMFAIALWDRQERKLTLIRDRMGEKPLYYGWAGGRFLFGSELKAMRIAPGFDNGISTSALDSLLRWSYVPSPLSIYRNIFKLLPGHVFTISAEQSEAMPEGFNGIVSSDGRLRIEPYWDLAATTAEARKDPFGSAEEAVDALESCLVEAISGQVRADVPVGTFLSGGIDSSTVAALQQKHSGRKIQTFTIGFQEKAFDESGHARAVAAHIGSDHHETVVTANEARDVIPDLPTIYDEPFADSSQIPTYLLSKAARRRVTVALSGDGADELFGGYDRYLATPRLHRRFHAIPRPAARLASWLLHQAGEDTIARVGAIVPGLRKIPHLRSKAEKAQDMLRHGQSLGRVGAMVLAQWGPSASPVHGADPRLRFPPLPRVAGLDQSGLLMLWDALRYLPDDILCKVDRAAMFASLETRAPFLDHRLVALAARIPARMKAVPGESKWILRQLLYRHVPQSLVDRPKSGLSVPIAAWLRGPLRDWAEDLLAPDRLNAEGRFDVGLVRSRWDQLMRDEYDYSGSLWPVLMFQAWHAAEADRGVKALP